MRNSWEVNPLWAESLESERLILTPFHLENYSEVWTQFCRANVEYFINPHLPLSPEDERIFLDSEIQNMAAGESENRFIYSKDTSQFLGTISVMHLDRSIPEIGLWLVVEAQWKWYGSEAYSLMLDWVRAHHPKVTHVAHNTLARNTASISLARHFNGKYIGEYWISPERVSLVFHIPL